MGKQTICKNTAWRNVPFLCDFYDISVLIVDDPVDKPLFLDTPYRHPLKMPIERIDFIDSFLFHNDQGKGIIDADSIFLCPLDAVPVIVC